MMTPNNVKFTRSLVIYGLILFLIIGCCVIYFFSDQRSIYQCLTSRNLDECVFIGKTLWQWLHLLSNIALPMLIFAFTVEFNKKERIRQKRQTQAEQERRELEKQVEQDRSKEQAFQDYLDRVSQLLLEKEHKLKIREDNQDDSPVKEVARSLTTTILRRLEGDQERQNRVIYFLRDTELSSHLLQLCKLDNANLSGVNLSGVNLSGANLSGTDLSEAILKSANLSGANLEQANLSGATLEQANLEQANLREANLSGAILQGAYLKEAYLKEVDLSGANLTEANLESVDFTDANLSGAILKRTNLIKANLTWAILKGTDLRWSNLTKAILKGTDLRWSNLTKAILVRSYLTGASFEAADLTRVIFAGAILQQVSFRGANLTGAYFSEAKLTHEKIKQIKQACFWEKAIFVGEWDSEKLTFVPQEIDNLNLINQLKQDTESNPDEPVDCRYWKK